MSLPRMVSSRYRKKIYSPVYRTEYQPLKRENTMKKLILLVGLCFVFGNILSAASKDPVAVLFQVDGKVEYTKKGRKWRKVRHSKFLFSGYQIRTSDNSSAKITIQKTGKNLTLGSNSHFEVTKNGLRTKKGKLTVRDSSSKLATGLMKRFTKSQTYTTVRRSAESNDRAAIDTARKIVISHDYPYLVWENAGEQYNYVLRIGRQVQHVPATSDMTVKARIKPFIGTQPLYIDVLEDDRVIASLQPYRSRGKLKDHTLTWIEGSKAKALADEINDVKSIYGDNAFMLGSLFEKREMWVAAMNQYNQYLADNPDEIEMTPYLFRVYKKLKLERKYKKELASWQDSMNE